jgi:hypothetical protein
VKQTNSLKDAILQQKNDQMYFELPIASFSDQSIHWHFKPMVGNGCDQCGY